MIFASPRFMKNGEIDWQKLERQVADLVNTAVESVAGAVKQRYVNDDGTWDSSIMHGPYEQSSKAWLMTNPFPPILNTPK